jgi:arylsulfatase A-like enzyme
MAKQGSRQPNILFILPDMWRGQALGCMGNRDVRTPNLDRLASEGVLFRHTFANTPVCCPARADILTGMYTHKNGMVANDLRLRESQVTLGELFSKAGYRTGYIGKWHLDGGIRLPGFIPPGPRRHGFQFWAANECSHEHFNTHYFRDSDVPIPIKKFEVEAWTDIAIQFLQETPRNQPFFLMIATGPPHEPYGAPEKYMKMYDPKSLTMRPNWAEGARKGWEAEAERKDIAAYYAAITAIDDQVERLMRGLEELDLEKDTIIVFTSDHGNLLGSHGMTGKRAPWEESIRVPGILRYPRKVKAGRQTEAFLTHVDMAPTLLALCGMPVPADMQGADLSGVVLGEKERGPDSAFFQIFGPWAGGDIPGGWRGIRTQGSMYARWGSGPWVLYDLKKDPYELDNLADNPACAAMRGDLERKLNEWMRKTGDSWSFDWTEPIEDKGQLVRYKAFYTVEEYLNWARAHPELLSKDQTGFPK